MPASSLAAIWSRSAVSTSPICVPRSSTAVSTPSMRSLSDSAVSSIRVSMSSCATPNSMARSSTAVWIASSRDIPASSLAAIWSMRRSSESAILSRRTPISSSIVYPRSSNAAIVASRTLAISASISAVENPPPSRASRNSTNCCCSALKRAVGKFSSARPARSVSAYCPTSASMSAAAGIASPSASYAARTSSASTMRGST